MENEMLQQIEVCHMITYSSWIILSQCSLSVLYWWRGFGFNTQETDSKTALKPASPAWCNEMTYGVFWYINHYGGGSTVTKKEEISTYTNSFHKAPTQMKICMLSPHLSCWRCFWFLKIQFHLKFFVQFSRLCTLENPVQCSHPHQHPEKHLRLGFTVALSNQLKCKIPKHHK